MIKVFIAPGSNEQINENLKLNNSPKEDSIFSSLQGIISIDAIAEALSDEEKRELG